MTPSDRIYRRLLRLYPRAFREAFDEDLTQLFRDQRKARGGKPLALTQLWLLAVHDVVTHALLEWMSLRRARTRNSGRRRARRKGAFMDAFGQDLRFALRSLRKNPGFTFVAAFTLALGIGATSSVFSVVSAVLLKPLPYSEPERLVRLFEQTETISAWPIAPGDFLDYRDRSRSLEALAVFHRADAELSQGAESERLPGMRVSSGFFELLGFGPLLGQSFARIHESEQGAPVVMVSEAFWARRLGRDPGAMGRRLTIDGEPHTLIGIVPGRFEHVGGSYRSLPHGAGVDVWRPLTFGAEPVRGQHFLNAVGRLRAEVTVEEAEAELDTIAEALEAEFPASNEGWRVSLMPLHEEIVHNARPMLLALLGAVGLVLLIACVNVANLLLARAQARERELALRIAMGAARRRLVSQVLTESLLLALMGGSMGLVLAWLGSRALVVLGPERLPRLPEVGLDLSVVGFAVASSFVTALAFGVIPAWRQSRIEVASSELGARASDSRHQRRLRAALVVAELSVAIVLLIGAGLMLRTLQNLQGAEPGFRQQKVLTAHLALPEARYPEMRQVTSFFYELVERVRSLPGVEAAGAGSDLPWTGYDENIGVRREDRLEKGFGSRYHHATPGYFDALGVPLIAGRGFDQHDDNDVPDRIVINHRLAKLVWPEAKAEEVLGRRVTFHSEPSAEDWLTVIGVSGDVKDNPKASQAEPALYMAFRQKPWVRELYLVVRSDQSPEELLAAMRGAVRAMDADLPLAQVATLEAISDRVFSEPRFVSWLTATFAVIALLLALVGLYGVIAYTVSRETRTIAIHMALGARDSDILKRVLAQSLKLVGLGAALGATGAVGLTRWVTSLLYQVEPMDPWTLLAVMGLLTVAALAASLLPARRASRVQPIETLRYQ